MGFIECYYGAEHTRTFKFGWYFCKNGIALKRDIAHSLYERLKHTHSLAEHTNIGLSQVLDCFCFGWPISIDGGFSRGQVKTFDGFSFHMYCAEPSKAIPRPSNAKVERKISKYQFDCVFDTYGFLKDFSLAHFERLPNKIGENRLKVTAIENRSGKTALSTPSNAMENPNANRRFNGSQSRKKSKWNQHRVAVAAVVVCLMPFQTIDQIYGCRVCWTQRIL